MTVEWANLSGQRPITLAESEIALAGGSAGHLLLFHGLTGAPAELAYIAHYLHRRGRYSVWCPRLVNHGQPLGVLARTSRRELEQFAQDALARAAARARAAAQPLFVGGLSIGAVLSLILASDHPGDVSGVICLSPTLFYDGWNVPWTHRLIPLVAHTPLKNFAYFREDPPYGLKDEVMRERIGRQYASASLHDARDAAAAGYAHFPVSLFCEIRHVIARCIRRLDRVLAPVLLVQAVNDDITGPENSEFIYRRLGSARKEILYLENSYHVVSADLERERVAREMARFCASCS